MPKEIRTEIEISSNPSKIWKLLMNFEKYPEWNPFIKSIRGQAVEGAKIVVKMEPPGAKGMTFKPKILRINPEKEFRWLGNLFIKGLFDGEHIFELIVKQDGITTFIQREMFKGILVPLFKKMLDNNTRKGFELMNQQLKIESEK
jgi:hypothetical protein